MPRRELTDRQREILNVITETVGNRGYPPSVREIGDAVGLSSPSTVHSHLSALERSGYLRRDPSKPRAIEVIDDGTPESSLHRAPVRDVPLVGNIAAGSPILADEDIEEIYPLPTELVGSDPVFMLRVRGDSMVDAGIFDNDYVVVRRQPNANDGEIVAALVGEEEATVKRLRRKDGRVILESENPAYAPMVFTEGVELLGIVIALLRRVQ
jgi:repressor LexA